VVWTGLDPNAKDAYAACLEAENRRNPGLHIAVVGLTNSEVVIRAEWNIPGGEDANVEWSHVTTQGTKFTSVVRGGSKIVRFSRPKDESIIIDASFAGYPTELITVAPVPPPLQPEIPNCVKQSPVGTCVRCEFDVSETGAANRSATFASRTCTKMPRGQKVKFEVSKFAASYKGHRNVNCHMTIVLVGPDASMGSAIVSEATGCEALNRSAGTTFQSPTDEGFATVGLMLPYCDGHAVQVGNCEISGRYSIFTAEGQ
jgi:hypothetical protein